MKRELNEILNRLKTEHLGLSDKVFSKRFLNRNPTYYAFLKSTKKEPSMESMVTLWKNLRHEANIYEYQLNLANTPTQEHIIKKNINLYRELANKAFDAILA